MKKILLILFISLSLIIAGCAQPPEDVQRAQVNDVDISKENTSLDSVLKKAINLQTSSFEFEGFGPGKSHLGTFEEKSGNLYLNEEGQIIGFDAIIYSDSVKSDGDRLEEHLRSEDFFNSQVYPTIEFNSIQVNDNLATGQLSFVGITKDISFDINRSENSISTDFLLDVTDFNISGQFGVADEVRISFLIQ